MPDRLNKIKSTAKESFKNGLDAAKSLFKKKKPSDNERTTSSLPPSSPPLGRNQRTDSQPNLADYCYNPEKTENDLEAKRQRKEEQDREAKQVAQETADSRRRDAVRP